MTYALLKRQVSASRIDSEPILTEKTMGPSVRFAAIFAAYVAIVFVTAFGWHVPLFGDIYIQMGTRGDPILWLGILSVLLQAFVVAALYPRFYRGGHPLAEGLKFGLLLGVFMGSYGALAEAAKFNVSSVSQWVLYEGVFFLLQFISVGVVTALIHGRNAGRD